MNLFLMLKIYGIEYSNKKIAPKNNSLKIYLKISIERKITKNHLYSPELTNQAKLNSSADIIGGKSKWLEIRVGE